MRHIGECRRHERQGGVGDKLATVAVGVSLEGPGSEVLAEGQSNAEIAASLYLSENTVKTHVTHILDKLALRDRVHAVIYAYENGIVAPGSRP